MTGRGRPAHPPGGCPSPRRRLTGCIVRTRPATLTGRARLLQHSREQTATRQWTTASRSGSFHWKSVSIRPQSQYTSRKGNEREKKKKHRLVLVYCRYRSQGCSTLVHAVAPKTHFMLSPQPVSQSDLQPGLTASTP
ncbi:hypothetical protein ASPBRDRAFT_55151 [Aspergillus brasiliensis CBS 101740]|uniref:Uncharacterized protein n=1 Tax=Aspergillus brasiliensis (strain CBS 101740 / IMI 381727 / IBT 21946) TaxID=767769 RepID=A0A1L9UJS1_ASPBC|nr:hypothetical protein ASPBRDRAFT_55151 [Aspergillus brasiliensis CBS 101740]